MSDEKKFEKETEEQKPLENKILEQVTGGAGSAGVCTDGKPHSMVRDEARHVYVCSKCGYKVYVLL